MPAADRRPVASAAAELARKVAAVAVLSEGIGRVGEHVDELRIGRERSGERSRRAGDRDQRVAELVVVEERLGEVGVGLEQPRQRSPCSSGVGGTLEGRVRRRSGCLDARVDASTMARILVRDAPVSASPPPSSTSSSVTSRATPPRILDAYEEADAAGCDLIAFPELAVTGYPPEDLLLRPAFVAQAAETLDKIAARTGRLAAVIGFPEADADLYNAAAVCAHGKVHGVYRKHLLPNYAVFDEQRYFAPSTVDGPLFVVGGVRVGVTICEDAWSPSGPLARRRPRRARS